MTCALVVPTKLAQEMIARTHAQLPHSLRLGERRANGSLPQAAETSGLFKLEANA
jgi:hypothetical protein